MFSERQHQQDGPGYEYTVFNISLSLKLGLVCVDYL